MGLILFLRDLVIAISDAITGQARRRYEHSIRIDAPRDVVWKMLRARVIDFDGLVSLHVESNPVPGRPDCELVQISAGSADVTMLTRIADERPGEAILYEIMPEGTDPVLIEGRDDYIGFVLAEMGGGTRLDLIRETTPARWISRLMIPVGLRSGARRYRRKAEAMAREISAVEASEP